MGGKQGYIMSPWLFNVYINPLKKEVKMGRGSSGMTFLEDGREWRFPALLYACDLFLCGGKAEEDDGGTVCRAV